MRSISRGFGAATLFVLACSPTTTSTPTCAADTYDLNFDPADGCEYKCHFVSASDPFDDTYTDENCDGSDGNMSQCVFVDPTRGTDSASGGSPGNPLRSAAYAIPLAAAAAKSVCLASGVYSTSLTLASGVNVYGGFDGNAGFVRTKGLATTFNAIDTGIVADKIAAKTEVLGLSFMVKADSQQGSSAYGLRYTGSTAELVLTNVTFDVGAGTSGADGADGASGEPGTDGNPPSAKLVVESGGAAQAMTCGGTSEPTASGGAGGAGGKYGTTGTVRTGEAGKDGSTGGGGASGGAAGTVPGSGYTDCTTITSTNAGNGTSGVNAASIATGGAGGSASSKFDTSCRFQPGNGASGARGTPGAGGGGGGGAAAPINTGLCGIVHGGGGGGGGAGGCGGEGGGGGKGGGASIGICATGGTLRLVNTLTKVAVGGKGGKGNSGGAAGGSGGTGAAGADGNSGGGKGGAGGKGGRGGAGGPGGGGAGGSSLCAALGQKVTYAATNSTCAPLAGGAAGAATGSATPGAIGASAVEVRW
jgi:hypothetical protein